MQGCLKMNPRQVGHATKTLSSTNGNAAPVILILVIACLALAILILCTPEAAQLRIQGEVTLQVRFLATGQVEVLRVVNGLGHGLDEQAKRVAEQIRFKPAEKDGHPVDHTTLIHVTFQLA